MRALWESFDSSRAERRIKAFYETWKLLFSLSTKNVVSGTELAETFRDYGIEPVDVKTEDDVRRFLFILHTYYSVILKMLAFRIQDDLFQFMSVVRQIQADPYTGLKTAEDSFPKLAVNVVEKDVFSWFQDAWSSDISGILKTIAERMLRYDVRGVRTDVLKRVYQNLIPPKLRKSLGEFYTKDWTANLILDEIGYAGEGTLLDPACGSGTFLVAAIQRMKSHLAGEPPDRVLHQIINSVIGFDVNPMAVMTARLNYLLSILDLIRETSGGTKIPVYLCDSIKFPKEGRWEESFYQLELPLEDPFRIFRVPKDEPLLVLEILEKYAENSFESFNQAVSQRLGDEFSIKYRGTLRELHEQISRMQKEGVDGIWCRIIANFFAPLLVDKFDFVVGNPPWVAPENVPKEYRDSVNQLLRNSGYLQPYKPRFVVAKASFPQAEAQYVACLPFMTRTTERYLKNGARGSFLLTSALLKSLNAGGFRESMLKGRLEKVLDLSLYTSIHEGALCYAFAPVFENSVGSLEDKIDYVFYMPTGGSHDAVSGEEEPKLIPQNWKLAKTDLLVDTANRRSPWFTAPTEIVQIFKKMQKVPLLGNQYRINMGVKPAANKIFFVEEIERSEGGLVLVTNLGKERYPIESQLVYPLVRGRDIGVLSETKGGQKAAWAFTHAYIILAHDPRNGWKPIPEGILRKSKEAWSYFMKEPAHLRKLKARKDWSEDKGPPYMIFRLSPLKMATFKVAYADTVTRLSACVIPPKVQDTILGTKGVVVDGTADIITIKNEDQAHYVCALLNSAPLRSFAYTVALPKGGVPYKRFTNWTVATLPIPPYRPDLKVCKDLTTKSKEAHLAALKNDLTRVQKCEAEIDEMVYPLYGLTKPEVEALWQHHQLLSGIIPSEIRQQPQ